MPTAQTWVQTQDFQLDDVSVNGATVDGTYKLLTSGKWQWTATLTGRSPVCANISMTGQVDTLALAAAIAEQAVNSLYDLAMSLPAVV